MAVGLIVSAILVAFMVAAPGSGTAPTIRTAPAILFLVLNPAELLVVGFMMATVGPCTGPPLILAGGVAVALCVGWWWFLAGVLVRWWNRRQASRPKVLVFGQDHALSTETVRHLEDSGLAALRCWTLSGLQHALQQPENLVGVVVIDLASVDGPAALETVKTSRPDLPIIASEAKDGRGAYVLATTTSGGLAADALHALRARFALVEH